MKMIRNQKGFTLIELIVIIVIIGILAAIAIPTYVNLVQQAADGSARGVLGAIRSANALLFANNLLGNTPGAYTMGALVVSANVQGVSFAGTGANTVLVTIGGFNYTYTFATQPIVPTAVGAITEVGHPTW